MQRINGAETDGIEIFTDLSDRGTKKFSDDCKEDRECGFDGSYCDPKAKKCLCREEFHATNHIDKCGHGEFSYPISYVFLSRYTLELSSILLASKFILSDGIVCLSLPMMAEAYLHREGGFEE